MNEKKSKAVSALEFIFSTENCQNRDSGIDIIKSLAAYSVLSVHFFMHSGYYYIPMTSMPMFIFTIFRWIFFVGVPFFLMSTGYLKRNTKLCGMHYVKMTPVIITYLAIGIITIFYKIKFLGEEYPLFIWLRSLWSFDQPSYAWYVNMYLGLFIIMPFLSYGWNAIESQRKKQAVIILFAIVTALPMQFNRWTYMGTNLGFAPNMWTNMYSITYFFIGAYINEYKPKVKKWLLAIIFLICVVYQAVKVYITADGGGFYDSIAANYEDAVTVVTGTVLFLLLYDIKLKNKVLKAIFASISSVTLGTYLFSWITDSMIYKHFDFSEGVSVIPQNYLKIVPLNFVICFFLATILNVIVKLITQPYIKYGAKISAMRQKEKASKETGTLSQGYAETAGENEETKETVNV